MQAILNIDLNEIDDHLLKIIKELLSRNVEVVIKKESVKFERFDNSIPLDEVMREFEEVGYSEGFLKDLRAGLEASDIYAKHNEDKTVKR
jgi:hypothetical protein